jgi:hypothetical protein
MYGEEAARGITSVFFHALLLIYTTCTMGTAKELDGPLLLLHASPQSVSIRQETLRQRPG